jgi:hypothetical protein
MTSITRQRLTVDIEEIAEIAPCQGNQMPENSGFSSLTINPVWIDSAPFTTQNIYYAEHQISRTPHARQ